ncbi:MAG: LytTR family transcriptional regulator [Clostridia bacterium]|nr:LytTR family transcriptional regulator [Clostridia bacterium]
MKFSIIVDKEKEEQIVATVKEESLLTQKIEALVLEYNGENKILAYTEDDTVFLEFGEIECITVCDSKTYAVTCNGERLRLKKRLYELEDIAPSSFIRINKSTIANRSHIKKFTTTFSGGVDAIFKSGYKDYVSRRCFAEIKRRFISK